ncbi:Adenylyl/guanylyl cyclase domain-containing protein, BLUF domain-containing [Desulfonema limicola]|uniref:Adenylyl/guanylyl cyclase domain-containing protein, BLUF domain-containing n=1 Tax=Desulfonema limicola TaxID=45656 RepID=A0A975B9C5_9BACT|nr:BLUF domain-containing protein [Desulfonema limicola]QTA81394.1 Adenylyl/guanylyl cyclase domain-containing protein, BLUF domain-containing [Desulfonema limicola]
MKRLTYISRLSTPLSENEIEEIGILSSHNNQKQDITGVLIYYRGLFFQIIEGDDVKIDWLYEKIGQDKRHTDILCLKSEYQVEERLFPNWSMNVINLDNNTDMLIHPIKILLQTITESHSIIEQYTQPAVLKILNKGINPITVPARKVEKIILFADIVSFSAISENLPVELIALMINRYLEISSEIITAMGGEVTKYIGDCIMAYFAPEMADNAVQACLNILSELKKARQSAGLKSPIRLLYCGFGLSQGIVIEGNIGSAIKTDYTILGDPVNTAARLEALTRNVKKAVVLSENVKNSSKGAWNFISLGKHDLKGKEKNTEVYYPDHKLVNDFDVKDKIIQEIKNLIKETETGC